MGDRVIHSDLELFLTGYIRARLAAIAAGPDGPYKVLAAGVFVDKQFPRPSRPKTVVVRDDSGPDTSIITMEPSVGVTVLAGTDPTQGQEATDLALLVKMIVKDCAGIEPGNPVAAVLGANGPYKVPEESGQPRRYMTFELSVTGKPFS